jgi:hypothetical protein
MRVAFLVASFLALAASPALGRVPPQMPRPMEEAPVARAIENVARDHDLAPAQRERLLGRLHLIAYAQVATQLTRYSNGEWQPEDLGPCGDSGYSIEGDRGRLCPFGMEGLATPELPRRRGPWSFLATGHLHEARAHYERALALDDANLRAHLGLAYVLDQLNQDEAARVHLRRIIAIAPQHFHTNQRGAWVDWEHYVVLNEAVEHLADLAHSRADRAGVARLRAQLGSSRPSGPVTPIVVPLRASPFAQLIDPTASVAFDFAGTGYTRAEGWLTPDAAWLVWDPNQRGEVRSGFDLIGQRTWAVFWSDGFEAMRSLDDNGDGELTDAELGGLALWRDANVNGVSEPGEVRSVSEHGVVGLAVRGERERADLLTAPGGVHFADGTRLPLYDWTPGIGREPIG